jgi:hypothetical protein
VDKQTVIPPTIRVAYTNFLFVVQVRAMYNWPNVAQRTEAVYRAALAAPQEHDALLPRLRRYRSIGSWAGPLFCCVVVLLHWFWRLLEWQQPAEGVEAAADWPGITQTLKCADGQQQMRQPQVQQQQQQQQQQHAPHNKQQERHVKEAPPAKDDQPLQGAAQLAGGRKRYNLRSSSKQGPATYG